MNPFSDQLLGTVIASLALNYTWQRVRFRNLEWKLGPELGRFAAALAALLLVWIGLGLAALVVDIRSIRGWNWIPAFVGRLTLAPLLPSVAGLLFCVLFLACSTLVFHAVLERRLPQAIMRAYAARVLLPLLSLFLASAALDTIHIWSSQAMWDATRTLSYSALIGFAWVAGVLLESRGASWGHSLVLMVSFLLSSSMMGSLLEDGTVQGGRLFYGFLARDLVTTPTGALSLLAAAWLFWTAMGRPASSKLSAIRWPVMRRQRASAERVGPKLHWRTLDRATGKRVDWKDPVSGRQPPP